MVASKGSSPSARHPVAGCAGARMARTWPLFRSRVSIRSCSWSRRRAANHGNSHDWKGPSTSSTGSRKGKHHEEMARLLPCETAFAMMGASLYVFIKRGCRWRNRRREGKTMHIHLVVTSGPDKGRLFPLPKEDTLML